METQYIDNRFRPNLESYLQSTDGFYFRSWGIKGYGIPAPTFDEAVKSAVWIGDKVSIHDETPVLATVLNSKKFKATGSLWFVGFMAVEHPELLREKSKQLEMAALAIEYAEHGPHTLQTAANLLKKSLPTSTIQRM